jgi:endoglucanase
MKNESIDFLRDLINTPSPSGFEANAASVWKKRTKSFADSVSSDVHGNSIAVLNKKGAPRVMLAGHIDEIGYMIRYVDKDGYIYFTAIGGVDPQLVSGQRVTIKTKNGYVFGIVGRKPIHLQKKEDQTRPPKMEDMWIDIGAKDEKEAFSIVGIADPAVPAVGFEVLRDTRVVGRGFDDKAGAFVVSECMRLLKKERIKASVYGVATVQEELGLRGAHTSAYGISPDIGIAVDVTFAADVPDIDKKQLGDMRLGKGPVIARGPNINHKMFELLVKVAEKEKIPYQVEGLPRGSGTDANAMQLTKSGVATAIVSIPNRYMHTPVEIVDLADLENAARLISAFIRKLDTKIDFIPC